MEFRTLRLSAEGGVARLALSMPDRANRVDDRMLLELEAACEVIDADGAVSVVLVTGEGRDFCAGWDPGLDEGHADTLKLDPFGCLARLRCPVVAALHGATVSAGLELALACDVRIAADDLRVALPEVGRGTLPRAGGSQRLLRVAGRAVAASMLLLGEELDAQAALRAGIVSRVYAAGRLQPEIDAIVSQIASRGPLALRYLKEAVHQGSEMPLDHALRYELDLSVILQTTADRAEGVRAFTEKRPPHFEGR